MRHALLLLLILQQLLSHGQTMTICGNSPIPAGYVTISMGSCFNTNGFSVQRTIRRIDNLAPGSTVDICNTPESAIPSGWITVKMSTCNNPMGVDFEARTIRRFAGCAPGFEMPICNVSVAYRPVGWATISIGKCGWFESRTIKNLIGMAPGSVVRTIDTPDILGSITVHENIPIGTPTGTSTTVTAIGPWSPASAGWVSTTYDDMAFANGIRYQARTFQLAAGSPPGTEIEICNSHVPAGWATLSIRTCGPSLKQGRRIKNLTGMAPGSVVSTLDTPELPGWVTLDMYSNHVVGVATFLGRKLKLATGCRAGTVIQTCNMTTLPAGWLVTASSICNVVGLPTYRAKTITCLGNNRSTFSASATDSTASTGLHEGLLMFPNPSSGQVEIRLADNPQPQSVEIRDLMGQLVVQEIVTSQTATFKLPAGVYLVRTGSYIKRLIVK